LLATESLAMPRDLPAAADAPPTATAIVATTLGQNTPASPASERAAGNPAVLQVPEVGHDVPVRVQ